MFASIQKLLTCLVVVAAMWAQQGGAHLLMQANPAMWDHDGHHHTTNIVESGDFFVIILSHLPEAHPHGDSDEDDGDQHHDSTWECPGLSAHHSHSNHVVVFASSKLSRWQPIAAGFASTFFIEVTRPYKNEARFACLGVALGNGGSARPPPWGLLARHRVLRATVMMV